MSDLATKEPTLEELRRQREDLQIELDRQNGFLDNLVRGFYESKNPSDRRKNEGIKKDLQKKIHDLHEQKRTLNEKIDQLENPAPPSPPAPLTLSEKWKAKFSRRTHRPRSKSVPH
jgi:uncharacterized protein YceH (UPF0502 family)